MVRYNGYVMTEIKYQEILQKEAERKLSLYNRINLYFFGEEQISLSDAIWFYGMYCFFGVALLFLVLINLIPV